MHQEASKVGLLHSSPALLPYTGVVQADLVAGAVELPGLRPTPK